MGRSPSVLFLTSGRTVPSSRFRVGQYLERLRGEGFTVHVAPCVPNKYASHYDFRFGGWPLSAALTGAKIASRLLSILRAPFHDLLYVERELLPRLTPLLEEAAYGLNRRLVFDFDDAIFLRYRELDVNPVAAVCALARVVIAGNEYLADFARPFARRVEVVPTAIDTDRFRPLGTDDATLLWTGSSSNLKYLEALPLGERPLRVICDRKPSIRCEYVPWSEEAETRLAGIGLMPLPDDEWARGKCGFKLLQYMACGLPAVASPVGVNSEILADAGILAGAADEWAAAFDRLGDPARRRAMGERGRARVESTYSVAAVYPRWRNALLAALH